MQNKDKEWGVFHITEDNVERNLNINCHLTLYGEEWLLIWTSVLHTMGYNIFNGGVSLVSHKTNHREYDETSKNTSSAVHERNNEGISTNI